MESQEQSSLMSGIWATKNSQALELRIVNFVSMNFDYQSFVMIWFAPTAKAQLFENEKILICDFSRGVLNTCSARLYPILALRPQIRIISFSAGCIAIAFVAMLASKGSIPNPKLVLFLKTGICGGFTTFSTFALESATLMKSGHPKVAFLYMLLSILVGVGAIFITEFVCFGTSESLFENTHPQ